VAGIVTDIRDDHRVSGSVFLELALATRPRRPGCDVSLRERVLRDATDGAPPPGTQTFRAAQRAWHEIAPGVDIKLLRPDAGGCMTALVRMAAGATYTVHEHPLDESCLVLSGEIHIGAHRLRAGDLHVAAAGTTHALTSAPRGALLFVRTTHAAESFSC
jgi:quercetin dioxygenase-like cupin family protein